MKKTVIVTGALCAAMGLEGGAAAAVDADVAAAVRAFSQAADAQDAGALDRALHPAFRTVFSVTRAGDPTVISRGDYLGLTKAKKIGGDDRAVRVVWTERASEDVAFAKVVLDGKKATFSGLMTLVRHDGRWTVFQDAVRMDPKGK